MSSAGSLYQAVLYRPGHRVDGYATYLVPCFGVVSREPDAEPGCGFQGVPGRSRMGLAASELDELLELSCRFGRTFQRVRVCLIG